jgi:dihydrofolate reductase
VTIAVMMSVSADGYMEGPGHDIGWHLVDEEVHRAFNEHAAAAGAFLSGRTTYELMTAYWPTADQDPDAPEPIVEFARIWREKPKVVYSRTLDRVEGDATLVREVVPEEVRALAATHGDLLVGGAHLAASFLDHGLVDEFLMSVHPVAIGAGTPLFPPGRRVDLRLLGTRTFGNGVVLLRYACA